MYLIKQLDCPYDFFNSRVDNLKKEDSFSKLKNKCPSDEQIERKEEIINTYI